MFKLGLFSCYALIFLMTSKGLEHAKRTIYLFALNRFLTVIRVQQVCSLVEWLSSSQNRRMLGSVRVYGLYATGQSGTFSRNHNVFSFVAIKSLWGSFCGCIFLGLLANAYLLSSL